MTIANYQASDLFTLVQHEADMGIDPTLNAWAVQAVEQFLPQEVSALEFLQLAHAAV